MIAKRIKEKHNEKKDDLCGESQLTWLRIHAVDPNNWY